MKKIRVKAWAFGFILVLIAGCQNLTYQTDQKAIKRSYATKHAAVESSPLSKIPAFFKTFNPRSKPLSRYRNPLTYRVAGHQYAVMKNANGFKQRGLASWYGSKFHHRRTSSGEPYNMYALTAAHKTLNHRC